MFGKAVLIFSNNLIIWTLWLFLRQNRVSESDISVFYVTSGTVASLMELSLSDAQQSMCFSCIIMGVFKLSLLLGRKKMFHLMMNSTHFVFMIVWHLLYG